MANDIQLSLSLQVANGTHKNSFQQSGSFTQNALGVNASIVTVTTTAANITFSNIATDGIIALQNLSGVDPTNYVDYGVNVAGSLVSFGRIKAGEYQVLRLHPGVAFMAQAHTASVLLSYLLLND